MQLKSLRLFMAVVETGSFVAAAERLHTVQSNVTAHIKKLEAELGVQLIDRQGRARSTSAGRALARHAERILTAHDEAVTLFRGDETPRGRLRIGAMETTMALRLPPLLADFHAQHPEVDISLQAGPTADLVTGLVEGDLDCAFVAGRIEHRRFHQLKAFSERLVLVASEPLAVMPAPETLLASPFLAFRQGCSYRQRIELLLASQGVSATRLFEFGSLDAILGGVAAGMGFAILPSATVEAHRHRFDIHALELPASIAEVDTYFAAPPRDTWTPALSCFAETLREAVAMPEP
ncbi:LysR family transcriptional regulator [Halomonas faecis]|uniref:LysR family transcriptional regulator n=1 Tax=Halomonas faecis TaxID=1562110 RepID=UPI0013D8870E|nr:LysR family transcriptional regulator [Halomonas faecis]